MPITVKRILAYIFDVMIVSLISTMISNTTINPYYEQILNLNQEYQNQITDYNDRIQNLDESDQSESEKIFFELLDFNKTSIIKSSQYAIFENILTIILLILYFGLFAYLFEGETVGKRMFKLKITSKNNERVKFSNLLIRLTVLHALPLVIINSILPFILNDTSFIIATFIIYILSFILEIAIIITTFTSKEYRGLHDILAKTKVVEIERR